MNLEWTEGTPVSDEIYWCAKYQVQIKQYVCAACAPVCRMLFEVCNFSPHLYFFYTDIKKRKSYTVHLEIISILVYDVHSVKNYYSTQYSDRPSCRTLQFKSNHRLRNNIYLFINHNHYPS